jgi:hypothetical protein
VLSVSAPMEEPGKEGSFHKLEWSAPHGPIMHIWVARYPTHRRGLHARRRARGASQGRPGRSHLLDACRAEGLVRDVAECGEAVDAAFVTALSLLVRHIAVCFVRTEVRNSLPELRRGRSRAAGARVQL